MFLLIFQILVRKKKKQCNEFNLDLLKKIFV